jgi:hypothetical protein
MFTAKKKREVNASAVPIAMHAAKTKKKAAAAANPIIEPY